MSTPFRLQRSSDVDLTFDGTLLAEASTWAAGRDRWQVIHIYSTDSGRWVVERIGKSVLPGEVEKAHVHVCASPAEVREKLMFRQSSGSGTRTYMTDVCYDALTEAAEADPRLRDALAERV